MKQVRVLIVDDDVLMQKLLSEILESSSKIEVVGVASDPYDAREKIKKLDPDVVTLDMVMPRMDGLTFLSKIMDLRPTPVVVVSSLVEEKASIGLQALAMGAIEILAKPKIELLHNVEYVDEFIGKVLGAAEAKGKLQSLAQNKVPKSATKPELTEKPKSTAKSVAKAKPKPMVVREKFDVSAVVQKKNNKKPFKKMQPIIAVGASTGGTVAITDLLQNMPASSPAIVVAQHIPESFSMQFAARANGLTEMQVCEAEDGEPILPGHVYIAPGNRHLMIERKGSGYVCKLHAGPPVNRHRPSVDVLFRSVAQNAGSNAVGVILTGMGKDGAQGLKELHESGAPTIAQDEQSSVVWGMPKAALELNAASMVAPLNRISNKLMELF